MCYISMVFCNAFDNVFLKYCSISLNIHCLVFLSLFVTIIVLCVLCILKNKITKNFFLLKQQSGMFHCVIS